MRIGLLGELEVLDDDGRLLTISGAKLRSLLAMLALHVGRPVPTDQLVEALWGDDPPAGVKNSLQGLVSKLRRALGSTEVVAMRGGGYALELPTDAIDVQRFELLAQRGLAARASGDDTTALAALVEAGELWRGDALSDFVYDDFASGWATRLTELRVAAVEERIELELNRGRHNTVVAELETLVAAHPLRERLRGQLMVALYRGGRQADALRTFQEGRHLLADELGLEPSPELRQLESAMLVQDPALDWDASASSDSEPVPRWERSATIPAAISPLIGRSAEVSQLAALVDENRLVTLVGPGGVGKTRLGIEVARLHAAKLTHGGCLVELAPLGDPTGVASTIAATLGFPDPTRLAEMIGDRELLIVLDNCEHVIAAAAEVAEELLRRCPRLRLVATSREGLRVGGEVVWPVPPLPPEDAAALFAERAQAAGGRIDTSEEASTLLRDICRRLDGLPLAIELAAARTRAFSLHQLAARLDDRFRLLTGGSRTALPRQQTLRAVVDWSYELLFDDERRVFERLSVFPGGCDLATAETVCADGSLAADDIADVVHALVDKSLVLPLSKGDHVRFGQLQTLAQYAREKLSERPEAAAVRTAMASHYALICAKSAAAFIGDSQRTWLWTIDRDQDNLRAALEWAVDVDDAETALAIAGGASWPHWLAGTAKEGLRWLDLAFSCRGDATERTRALALVGRGILGFQGGRPGNVDADLAAALAVFKAAGDLTSLAFAHSFYAEVAMVRGETAEARRRRQDLLDLYLSMPSSPFVDAARAYSRAKLALLDGDLAAAESCYREAAEGFSAADRPMMHSITLGMVADFEERAGDHDAAIRTLERAIDITQDVGLRGFTGALLVRLGWLLLQEGRHESAAASYDRALRPARWLRNEPVVSLAASGLAAVHLLAGRDRDAGAAAREALDLFRSDTSLRFRNRLDPEAERTMGAAVAAVVAAVVHAEAGEGEEAARLLGFADRLGVTGPSFHEGLKERARDAAVALLGPAAFTAAFAEARRSGPEAAVPASS